MNRLAAACRTFPGSRVIAAAAALITGAASLYIFGTGWISVAFAAIGAVLAYFSYTRSADSASAARTAVEAVREDEEQVDA